MKRSEATPSTRKIEPQLWDDESGEPAPFTPEEVDARLEAANDWMERENQAAVAQIREIDELLSRKEAIVASLCAKSPVLFCEGNFDDYAEPGKHYAFNL